MIIGISGKIGSGKDTCANMILDAFPQGKFAVHAFALKLKKIVAELTGTTLEMNISREGKAFVPPLFAPYSLGRIQQLVGSGFRQTLGEDVWVNALFSNPDIVNRNIVITDVRYPNEKVAIEKRGGVVIRLEGDPAEIREINADKRDLNHESETALDNVLFDYLIVNNGTLNDLLFELINLCISRIHIHNSMII